MVTRIATTAATSPNPSNLSSLSKQASGTDRDAIKTAYLIISETTYKTNDPHPHLTSLQQDGFVVIRNLLPPQLLLTLQATCKQLTDQARKGEWPHVRTVPKQYPPWPTTWTPDTNIWGIQHLLHPSMDARDVFAEVYFSDEILDVVKELLGLDTSSPPTTATTTTTTNESPADDKLVMELFNLLVSPGQKQDFELAWHRDDIKPDVTPAEEQRQLDAKSPHGRQLHAQYNVALFDDDSLVVVPGSHRRVRTATERHATRPDEPTPLLLPGQRVVELGPGDAVFYDSNILHRGVYRGIDEQREGGRMTLHGSVGLVGHGNERARQVLQHAVGEWVGKEETRFTALGERQRRRAEGMRSRLVEMGTGEGLGYSLDG